MKKIEKLYIILTQEDGEETIAGITMQDGYTFQAVSSQKRTIDMVYKKLKERLPNQPFTIKEFERSKEIK